MNEGRQPTIQSKNFHESSEKKIKILQLFTTWPVTSNILRKICQMLIKSLNKVFQIISLLLYDKFQED